MSGGIQVCVRCGKCEDGRTGPANRYLCTNCHRLGYRANAIGHVTGPWPVAATRSTGDDAT